MMTLTFTLLALFAGFYLILRKMCEAALAGRLPAWSVLASGLLAWLFTLTGFGWIVLTVYLIADLFLAGTLGNLFVLMFIGMASGYAYLSKEMLDASNVMHFLRTAIFFRSYASQTILIDEELDKKKIRDVHRETSDKPFPTLPKERSLLSHQEIERLRAQVLASKGQPRRSAYLQDELQDLMSGRTIDLTDGWRISTFDRSLHDLYGNVVKLAIDPKAQLLSSTIDIQDATSRRLRDPIVVFHLKQDLYDFLHVLNTDPWLKPYSEFFDRIGITCRGIESDSFGQNSLYPFLKIEIARGELFRREGTFFNAADLQTIASITFNNGKPLQL
jgi:hypothetical protein